MKQMKSKQQECRPVYLIAKDVIRYWKKINPAARPWLAAMEGIKSVEDVYMFSTGSEIIRRFLMYAGKFKGKEAERIKKELESLLS